LVAVVSLFGVLGLADEDHEDLTAEQLGTIDFPVSCAPSVQQPFARAVARLHSFWYEEAEKEICVNREKMMPPAPWRIGEWP
jgi:hypothetical protein